MAKGKNYNTLFYILSFMVFANTVFSANLNDIKKKKNNIQKNINQTQKNINQTQEKISQNEKEQRTVMQEIEILDVQVEELQKELNKTNEILNQVTNHLEKTEIELKITEEEQERNYEALRKSIKVSYEHNGTGYLQLLLEAENFASFLRRLDIVSSVIAHNDKIFQITKEKKIEIEKKKNEIATQKQNVELLKQQQVSQKKNIETAQLQKQQYINQLQKQQDEFEKQQEEYEKQLDLLEKTESQLSAEIQRILSQNQSKNQSKNNTVYTGGVLAWPAPGYSTITSPFGYRVHPVKKTKRFHAGIDIATPSGSKIVAAADGTVIISQWYGGYGNLVAIDHGGGIVTMYGHNSSNTVSVGDVVKKNQKVANSGNTGVSTGPHLHFEVKKNGTAVNPMGYLR